MLKEKGKNKFKLKKSIAHRLFKFQEQYFLNLPDKNKIQKLCKEKQVAWVPEFFYWICLLGKFKKLLGVKLK